MANYRKSLDKIIEIRLDSDEFLRKLTEKSKEEVAAYLEVKWKNIRGDEIDNQSLATAMLDAEICLLGGRSCALILNKRFVQYEEPAPILHDYVVSHINGLSVYDEIYFLEWLCLARIEDMVDFMATNYPAGQRTSSAMIDILAHVMRFKHPEGLV